MRKITIILGSVLAGLVVLGAALFFFIDVQQFRGPLQDQLTKRLRRKVELGPIGLSIFPLSLRLDGVTIGDDPRFSSSTPFLKARQMFVSADLSALLNKRIEVTSLRLTEPSVSLIRDKAGLWNAATLGSESTSSGGSTQYHLDELRIERGTVSVTDLRESSRPSVYSPIDMTLRDYAPGARYRFEASLALPKPGGGTLALSGAGTREAGPSEGKINFHAVPVSALRRLAGSPGTSSPDYILDGDISAVPRDNALAASGRIAVRPGGDVQFEARYQRAEGLLDIQKLDTAIGHSHLRANGQVRLNDTPARLALNVQSDDAVLSELQQLAATLGAGWQGETNGVLRFNVRLEGPLTSPAWTGRGSIADLTYKAQNGTLRAKPVTLENINGTSQRIGANIDIGELTYQQLVLTQVHATSRMDGSVLRLDPLDAQLYGGSGSGNIAVDTRSGRTTIAVRSKLANVDAAQLLAATTSVKQTLFGKLAADADLQVTPQPGQDPARGLNGKINLNLADGRIAGVQIFNELAALAGFAGFKPSDKPYTSFVGLAGAFLLKDGVAQTENLRLDYDGGSLIAAGTLDLVDQTIQLRLTSTLPKSVSQQFAGSQAAGWMSTFLGNSKGEYVIPARVTGTLSHPKFTPDPERMAKMKLEGFTNSQSINDSVRGIMDLFKKKK